MKEFTGSFLLGSVILLSVLIFFCMIRAIKGPRFTDRVVAGNMISTMIIVILSILSVYMSLFWWTWRLYTPCSALLRWLCFAGW